MGMAGKDGEGRKRAGRERTGEGQMNGKGRESAWVSVILFCLLIFGGMAWSILQKGQTYSESENRFLAEKPELTWKNLLSGSYAEDYESYITDRFPMRDSWIAMKTRAELALGKSETKGVLLGRDGYLIVNYPSSDFESERAEKNAAALGEALAYYVEKLGVDHVRVLLVPTASQILRDKLPSHSPCYNQAEYIRRVKETARERLEATKAEEAAREWLEATKAQAEVFVDVEASLDAHAPEYIYYRTDHHWTTLGAYYVYQEWARSLGFQPVSLSEGGLWTVSEDFLGTTYSKLHTAERQDMIQVYAEAPEVTLLHNQTSETEGFYDWTALEKRDQYALFLGGNDGLLEITREDGAAADRVLLVVKDSFANCFLPFATEHYGKMVVVDLRYINMSLQALAEQYGATDLLILYNVQLLATDASVFKVAR